MCNTILSRIYNTYKNMLTNGVCDSDGHGVSWMDRPCANQPERTSDLIFFQHHPLKCIKHNTHTSSARCALFELKETITLPRRHYIYLSLSCPTNMGNEKSERSGIIETVRRAAILISIYASAPCARRDYHKMRLHSHGSNTCWWLYFNIITKPSANDRLLILMRLFALSRRTPSLLFRL